VLERFAFSLGKLIDNYSWKYRYTQFHSCASALLISFCNGSCLSYEWCEMYNGWGNRGHRGQLKMDISQLHPVP
jgi:hypothetical protein